MLAKPEAFDELFQPTGFGLFADGEPRLAGGHRDADGECVGTHRQAADRVELDTLFGGEIDDGLAHDGEAGAGVDRVLAVDVVIAGLSTRELERDVALFVAALDHVECVLPGSSHRGNGTTTASVGNPLTGAGHGMVSGSRFPGAAGDVVLRDLARISGSASSPAP